MTTVKHQTMTGNWITDYPHPSAPMTATELMKAEQYKQAYGGAIKKMALSMATKPAVAPSEWVTFKTKAWEENHYISETVPSVAPIINWLTYATGMSYLTSWRLKALVKYCKSTAALAKAMGTNKEEPKMLLTLHNFFDEKLKMLELKHGTNGPSTGINQSDAQAPSD